MISKHARQSFLGAHSETAVSTTTVGVVGLGGGGSHVVQQFAHVGFRNFVLYDDDVVEDTNLNRLVGANLIDVLSETRKLQVAKRIIYGLEPDAQIEAYACRWQERPEPLRSCHIVVGCIETYKGREELEIACRRYLVHYVDIGMDVHGGEPPVIGGQVIQSSPGGSCMRCMGFLTDEKLAQEARKYGKAGGKPQVVWPNGVLASSAVGLAVDLVTGWTGRRRQHGYLVYDGNEATVKESHTIRNLGETPCPHFETQMIGDPVAVEL